MMFYSIRRTQRQNSSASSTHEGIPYARLIDSPNRKLSQVGSSSTSVSNDPSDAKLKANRIIRMPTPKASVSESKLTVDYFQKSDLSVSVNTTLMFKKKSKNQTIYFQIE